MSRTILITGVSSGIGHALAATALERGDTVLGVSRRTPEELLARERFRFASADLTDVDATISALQMLLADVPSLDVAILNAGRLSPFGDLSETSLDELRHGMEINVWANKTVLDWLFSDDRQVKQVVAISSGASVNGHRGWNGYSISKAALNMLTQLYAAEQPDTHFTALAPGIVDTAMQAAVAATPIDSRFPALDRLREQRGTPNMPTPAEAAPKLWDAIDRLPQLVKSGAYADVRKSPIA